MNEPSPNSPREPDQLLLGINRSILAKALLISAAVHAAVLLFTSFALYRDWAELGLRSEAGFHTPSVMKQVRQKRIREADAQERAKREEARRADQAARALEDEERRAAAPKTTPTAETPVAPPEIEPLPQRPFSLDDLPDLEF